MLSNKGLKKTKLAATEVFHCQYQHQCCDSKRWGLEMSDKVIFTHKPKSTEFTLFPEHSLQEN